MSLNELKMNELNFHLQVPPVGLALYRDNQPFFHTIIAIKDISAQSASTIFGSDLWSATSAQTASARFPFILIWNKIPLQHDSSPLGRVARNSQKKGPTKTRAARVSIGAVPFIDASAHHSGRNECRKKKQQFAECGCSSSWEETSFLPIL